MLIFAIALRSKASSNNWENVQKNFNRTIKSLFNQTDGNFLVYVGCNDIPKTQYINDPRLRFLKVNTPVPKEWIEAARDKFWKYSVISMEIRKYLLQSSNPQDGVFVMPLDADDIINKNIVEYVNTHDGNGFVSEYGYVWHKGNKFVEKYNELYTYCGSCNIIKMYLDDFPTELPDESTALSKETATLLNHYPIRWNHNEVVEKYGNMGKPFSPLPFPSTIYFLNNGENISSWNDQNNRSRSKYIKIMLLFLRSKLSYIKHFREIKAKRIPLDSNLLSDFGKFST